MSTNIILKIEQRSEQVFGPVRKIIGLLQAKSFNQLVDITDLSANPRLAKKGSVTQEIETSLAEKPELFPAKTKGLLLASTSYQELERGRFRLDFKDPDIEGLLDGGHNALAAARHVLREAGIDEDVLTKVKDWKSLRAVWDANRDKLQAVEDSLIFQMPVEIQVPADMDNDQIVDEFRSSLLEIGAARNNNVQLSEATKANQQKLFEDLRANLPTAIADVVEWKSNDGGRVKVHDIVALTWIALSRLKLPDGIGVSPNQLYRNKAVAVDAYIKLMTHKSVSKAEETGYGFELINPIVASALKVAAVFPEIYDALYEAFPDAYNKAGGSFGKITAIKIFEQDKVGEGNPKYMRTRPKTPYFQREVKYTCPDGFLMPFVYGLRVLLDTKEDGTIYWKTDPVKFVKTKALDVMKSYRLVLELGDWDPQKVGKNIGAYDFAEKAIANA